ncbi:GntR family transcriptional regulator [Brasilonema sp. UFV-L1]|uniref:GntR family transcriptional regulator n=1 Tax=Brasilonema sp. UFV-L1 TaxID=2234130 RepID=UPI00145F00C2|nr:GntR family transcriptional regulator [Brasilonema sp. UFV-L1]NMG06902.1 GntR family transcriptional regulator [Brasilonema sp. UFV-L1]
MVFSVPVWLPITIDNSAPITINAQIVEQIKLLIAIGELQPGNTLPTVTQLAKHLGVNHNTIAAVYNFLIESGYLVATRGKGTFVAHTQAVQDIIIHKEFYNLLSQAFSAAATVGLSPSEFGVAAYAQAVRLSQHQPYPLKLVFIECFQHDIDAYEAIQLEIGLPVLRISLEDFKAHEPTVLKELLTAHIIITTAEYQSEVIQLSSPEQEVITVNLKPDIQLLTQISSKPRHTKMLVVSRSKADSEEIKRMLELAGISHIIFQTLDLDNLQKNPQFLSEFDVVCVDKRVEKYVRQCSPQSEKIMVFHFRIDSSSISILKGRIAAIQLALSTGEKCQ